MAQERSSPRITAARCPNCGFRVPLRNLFLSSPLRPFSCTACGTQLRLNAKRNARWAQTVLGLCIVAILSVSLRHNLALWLPIVGFAALAIYPFIAVIDQV